MKRWTAVAGLAAALAFAAAGCSSGPENGGDGEGGPKSGGVVLKHYPKAGDWEPMTSPVFVYPANAAELDVYAGEKISGQLRANLLESLYVKRYALHGWDSKPKPDNRFIRVELYFHQVSVGAGKTFQQWHQGASITDLGEKAFAEQDAIVFLRGSIVCRLVPERFAPRTAGEAAIQVGKAIDAWLQGK